jgi:dolichol-phosphate mannosyltransferase
LSDKPEISIVVPVYMCGTCLEELCRRLKDVLGGIEGTYEIILVNDASPDNSWEVIRKLSSEDVRIKGLCLSRNFGQHYAITAGLEHSSGNWVVVMDGDLQDRPEEITRLHERAKEGADIVFAQRTFRKHSFFKKLFSKAFYKVLEYLTETKQDNAIGNFGIYHRQVIDAICSMQDHLRYFPTMVRWVGFTSTKIPVDHDPRFDGKTSYNMKKLIRLALDVMLAFSDKPLKITVKLGLLISFLAILAGVFVIIRYMQGKIMLLGYASTILSIWFFSGIIIFVLGIVGLYVGKTFEKVKGRPSYIVARKINFE